MSDNILKPNFHSNGLLFFFDFAPVLERSGKLRAYPSRLHAMAEPCVRRIAPDDAMITREGGFFLSVKSASGSAAEALAHDLNVALLELFFDAAHQPGLSTICRKAAASELEGGNAAPHREIRPAETDMVEADPLARLAGSGVPGYAGLQTGFLPMINLRKDMASIYWCGAVASSDKGITFGSEALAGIDMRDRPSLDEAMLEYSAGFARRADPAKFTAAIGASVCFETLAWSRGRQIYQKALRNADVAGNPFFLLRIQDIPPGTPPARLAEIVGMVKPFVKRVFVEMPQFPAALIHGNALGAAGLISALPAAAQLPTVARLVTDVRDAAAKQQALPCVTNVGGVNGLALARTAGIRFAAKAVAALADLTRTPLEGCALAA